MLSYTQLSNMQTTKVDCIVWSVPTNCKSNLVTFILNRDLTGIPFRMKLIEWQVGEKSLISDFTLRYQNNVFFDNYWLAWGFWQTIKDKFK